MILFLNYIKKWNILKNKNIYIFIQVKNYNLAINMRNNNLKISKNLNLIKLQEKENDLFKKINIFLKRINNFTTEKINFAGKGFKIRKKKNATQYVFNKSHNIFSKTNVSVIKKINKNSLIIVNKNPLKLKKRILEIFKFNKFTKKGLRASTQILKVKKK